MQVSDAAAAAAATTTTTTTTTTTIFCIIISGEPTLNLNMPRSANYPSVY